MPQVEDFGYAAIYETTFALTAHGPQRVKGEDVRLDLLQHAVPLRSGDSAREIGLGIADAETRALVRLMQHGASRLYMSSYGTAAYFNNAIRHIEQHDMLVTSVVIPRADLPYCIEHCRNMRPCETPACSRGCPVVAHLWTADIYVTDCLPQRTAMFFAKPDRVGVFADRCHIHQTKLRFGQPAVASVAGLALINSDLAYYVEGLDWAV